MKKEKMESNNPAKKIADGIMEKFIRTIDKKKEGFDLDTMREVNTLAHAIPKWAPITLIAYRDIMMRLGPALSPDKGIVREIMVDTLGGERRISETVGEPKSDEKENHKEELE